MLKKVRDVKGWSLVIFEGGRYDEKVGYSKNSLKSSRLDSIIRTVTTYDS